MKHLRISLTRSAKITVPNALPLSNQSNCNVKHKLRQLQQSLDKALQNLNHAHQVGTKEELVAKYEIVEDLAFALRRYQNYHEFDPLESTCIDHPDLPECKVFDL